jgi:signal transduction histidine kinase
MIQRWLIFRWAKLTMVLFFYFVCVTATFAQNIDSIKKVVSKTTTPDSIRVILYCDLADYFVNDNADSALVYIKQALELGNKINYDNGLAEAYVQYGNYYIRTIKYDSAVNLFTLAVKTYTLTGNQKGLAKALKGVGNAHICMESYGLAIDNYKKSLSISQSMDDKKNTGDVLSFIGNVYRLLGNFPKALKYYFEALTIFEQEKDFEYLSSVFTNISIIYTNLGDLNKALEYLTKSLEIDEKLNNKRGMVFSIVNMGILYAQKQDYNSALSAFKRGLALSDTLHDEFWGNTCKSNVAEAYYYLGQYDEALKIYKEVLQRSIEIKEQLVAGSAQNGIGKILMKQGKLKEGIVYLESAFNSIKSSGLKQAIMEMTLDLSNAYEKVNDSKNALKYHKLYYDIRDSVYNEKNSKQIQQLQFDYELQKKEAQIEILEKNKTIALEKGQKQRVIMWALITGLVSLLVFIIVLYRSRQKEKQSKEKILLQKEEIQLQATKLEELNRFKDKTFSVLSHDLRGPITAFASTMMMLDEEIITPDEFKQLQPEITKQLNSLNILLDNLLNWGRSYMKGNIGANPENVAVNSIMKQTTALLTDVAAHKNIEIVNQIADTATVYCDPAQLDIVMRNLVSNAIKFTRHGGSITLSSESEGSSTLLKITDTGIGMTPEQIAKLFTINTDNNTFGTDGEKGMGLGLLLCAEFIKTNNGKISVTSQPGVGSIFVIELPKQG